MSEAVKTTDHETIRKSTEERGGKPAHVDQTGSGDDRSKPQIDCPGGAEASLEAIG